MPSVGGIKRRLTNLKPHVQSAFIVYVTPRKSPVTERVEDEFEVREVTTADDPILPKVCASWQLPWAKQQMQNGTLTVIVALKDGVPIGRIWESVAPSHPALFSGVPRVKLAKDEFFMYDLFVEREYRRSNIGMTMADYFFRRYDPDKVGDTVKYGYGFISYENAPSILWHHSIGFNVVQTINYLAIGDRVKWRIPFSDVPRFGPMSRKGRHTDPDQDLFGFALFPNL
jgi:hypothetical protein